VDVLLGTRVDLILSDYLMPGMNGLDFLKQACVLQPEALRIMLTGVADPDVILSAINEGQVYRYVLKPWDDFDLRVMVRLALRDLEVLRERDPGGADARGAVATTGLHAMSSAEARAQRETPPATAAAPHTSEIPTN
jgi:response regulator RpfG family c-di-GMP phosphodiesterase